MRSVVRPACIISVAIWLSAAAVAQNGESPRPVRGVVVDASGRPVAGARVGAGAQVNYGRLEPKAAVPTDAQGRFQLRGDPGPIPLIALGPQGRRGAVHPPAAEAGKPLRLVLRPLGRVRIEIEAPQVAYQTEGSITISLHRPKPDPSSYWLALASSKFARTLELELPPGRYEVGAFNFATRIPKPQPLTVESGATASVKLRLEPTKIVRLAGQPPPAWHVLAARGLSKDVQPKDFRGKWLLLEFWGFW